MLCSAFLIAAVLGQRFQVLAEAPTSPTSSGLAFTDVTLPAPNPVTVSASAAPNIWPSPSWGQGTEIHGFLSQGYLRSTANNFLTKTNQGSFAFGEAGINLTRPLTERMSFGLQLFAQAVDPAGPFQVKADWFHLDYRFADWFGLRAGKVKLPFGLYNDIADVDAARVPVLLPQSVYPNQNRNFLLAQSGGEAYGFLDLEAAGALEYRVYGGTIVLDFEQPIGRPFRLRSLTTPYLIGTRLMWEPVEGLKVGPSLQALRLDADVFFIAVTQTVSVEIPATLWVGSVEYTYDDLQLSAEYSRWHITTRSDRPALVPESRVVNERAYALATYRLSELLQVGTYYSLLVPDVGTHRGRSARQDDAAATLRVDLNRYWLVKLEGHLLWGTAGLEPGLNGDRPLDALEGRWGLFLLKTTAYF